MLYHSFYEAKTSWIGEQVKAALDRMEHKKPVFAGLFVPALTPQQLTVAVNSARDGGASGISFFPLTSMT